MWRKIKSFIFVHNLHSVTAHFIKYTDQIFTKLYPTTILGSSDLEILGVEI